MSKKLSADVSTDSLAVDLNDLKAKLKIQVENFPDIANLVATGKLIKKGAWYTAKDKATLDIVGPYMSGARTTKAGGEFKIQKPPNEKMKRSVAKW